MRSFVFLFILISVCFNSTGQKASTLHPWEVFEISFSTRSQFSSPYVEGLKEGEKPYLMAEFTGISGEANGKSILIPGFWDGDLQWKIRFSPPFAGEWRYATQSADHFLNNKKGRFNVSEWTVEEKTENPIRRGVIQVMNTGERKGRYFTYFDGTPFLWVGDTWWNWTKDDITFNSFKNLADTRAAQHYTVGQLFFAGNGWGPSSSLLDDATYQIPHLEQIRNVEEMIRYANQKGITVWIHAWWSRENINETIGAENMRRWWRYVVHRLQAYNVIWVLAGEYNMYNYGGFDISFWNELGTLIKNEDPFDRITSAHPTPPGWDGGAGAPQWSTAEVIQNQEWLDYNQSQPGHGKWRNELIPEIVTYAYHREPPKPIVVTEPWYEFIEGNPTSMDIRFGAWTAFLSGAAGHSYGGGHVWRAHLPESPSGVGAWPLDTSFTVNTMLYKGAESLSFFSEFLHRIKWWELEPHPEFVLENPSHFCSAVPGEEYLIYLRYGGSLSVDLQHASGKIMKYEWIDLSTEKSVKQGELNGGNISSFSPPEDYPGRLEYKDWLLHIIEK
jgi:hypothetical protein